MVLSPWTLSEVVTIATRPPWAESLGERCWVWAKAWCWGEGNTGLTDGRPTWLRNPSHSRWKGSQANDTSVLRSLGRNPMQGTGSEGEIHSEDLGGQQAP